MQPPINIISQYKKILLIFHKIIQNPSKTTKTTETEIITGREIDNKKKAKRG